jgi:hypothetical protein
VAIAVVKEDVEPQFEYEVAFSFCSQDEGPATALDDLLKDRFKTFVYSRKQEVLAGTDGEKTFNEVFTNKARVAVILYRPEWGETPFTRIERDAIRKRAYHEGYDFTLWIAIEEGAKMPPYVEPTRLYFGLTKYGIESAAAVIEQCIQRQGGNTRPESLEEKAERLKRQKVAQEERIRFLQGGDSVIVASTAACELMEAVAARAAELTDWQFGVEKSIQKGVIESWVEVITDNRVLCVTWKQRYANTLDETELGISIWKGQPPHLNKPRYYFRGEQPPCERVEKFDFDRTLDGRNVWKKQHGKEQMSQAAIVDYAITMLLNSTHKAAMDTKPRHM